MFTVFTTQTTEMHIFAVIMLHQHTFCVYKGKRNLKLLTTCEVFVGALTVFILLCKYCFENMEKLYSRGFREGRSGYSKHNFFFYRITKHF